MTGLAVPTPASVVPGGYITAALWNAGVYNATTFLLGRPMADLYQTTSQSVANVTIAPIAFDSTTVDTYGGHSNTVNNSRYTAQQPGWYWVYGAALFNNNSAGFRSAIINKNGVGVNGTFAAIAPSAYYGSAVVCGLVQMAVGDYVELGGYQNSGGALATATGGGQCSAMKVWWMHA
ncbi:hypothetical protein ACPC54_17990 [Kitasatospora sp. NPDC094028]